MSAVARTRRTAKSDVATASQHTCLSRRDPHEPFYRGLVFQRLTQGVYVVGVAQPPLTREQAEISHAQAPDWQLPEEAHHSDVGAPLAADIEDTVLAARRSERHFHGLLGSS